MKSLLRLLKNTLFNTINTLSSRAFGEIQFADSNFEAQIRNYAAKVGFIYRITRVRIINFPHQT